MAPTPAKPSSATTNDRDANTPSPRLDLSMRLDQAIEIHRSRPQKWAREDVYALTYKGKTIYTSGDNGKDFALILGVKWHVCGRCDEKRLVAIHKELLTETAVRNLLTNEAVVALRDPFGLKILMMVVGDVYADFRTNIDKKLEEADASSKKDGTDEAVATFAVVAHQQMSAIQRLTNLSKSNTALSQLAHQMLQTVIDTSAWQPKSSTRKRKAAEVEQSPQQGPDAEMSPSTQLAKKSCIPGLFATPAHETVDPTIVQNMVERLPVVEKQVSEIQNMHDYIREQLQECGSHTYETSGTSQKLEELCEDCTQRLGMLEKDHALIASDLASLAPLKGVKTEVLSKVNATVAGFDARNQILEGRLNSEMATLRAESARLPTRPTSSR